MAISHRIGANFLGICQGIALTGSAAACGQINISHWDLAHNYLKPGLLLEALHQFAVRFATAVSKNTDPTWRYLPVMVEQFDSAANFDSELLRVEGHIELINDAYRIHCKATPRDNHRAVIAQAIIMVSKVYLPESASDNASPTFLGDLYNVSPLTGDTYSFSFNAHHPLFQEHFPSRAVCPGSLLIDMVLALASCETAENIASVTLEKVKFIEAVYPGNVYLLAIKREAECDSSGVFYIHAETKKRCTCGKFSIKYRKDDAICSIL